MRSVFVSSKWKTNPTPPNTRLQPTRALGALYKIEAILALSRSIQEVLGTSG